jgi:hypothetical protein
MELHEAHSVRSSESMLATVLCILISCFNITKAKYRPLAIHHQNFQFSIVDLKRARYSCRLTWSARRKLRRNLIPFLLRCNRMLDIGWVKQSNPNPIATDTNTR